jgi:hypothetical protein
MDYHDVNKNIGEVNWMQLVFFDYFLQPDTNVNSCPFWPLVQHHWGEIGDVRSVLALCTQG